MKKLLLLLLCVLTAVGGRAAVTTFDMSSSKGTGTLSIDSETGVATVTVTSGEGGHVLGEWLNPAGNTPAIQADVIAAMNGVTKIVYASGSIFSSADFNDVLNLFPSVTTVDATGIKFVSSSGHLNIKNLQHVQTLIFDDIAAPANNYVKVSIDNCDALTTLSMVDAFVNYSTQDATTYALAVTNNDNLTSINLSGANIGGETWNNPNLDFSGNTSLTTLDLSGVSLGKAPGNANINLGTDNNIQTMVLPEKVSTNQVTGAENVVFVPGSSSEMALHIADADDPYTYWYQGDKQNGAEITINMSDVPAGQLRSVLSAQINRVNKVKITGTITEQDIEALSDVNALILDLSEATLKGTMTANSTVRFLIMPDGSTLDEVTAAASHFTNLLSALALWEDADGKRHLVAHNNVAGSLQAAVCATGLCTADGNFKRGDKNAYYPVMGQLTVGSNTGVATPYVTLSGEMNAYDISSSAKKLTNGHFVWDIPADERFDPNTLSDPRKLDGTETVYGALTGLSGLEEIDMEHAIFREVADMTLSSTDILSNYTTWKVVIPTSTEVKEIPAWFLGSSGSGNGVKEICIPSNIEIIRTHAFVSVDHIWTTANKGDIDGTIYDNGAWDTTDPDNPIETKGYKTFEHTQNGVNAAFGGTKAEKYGTYTFSSNLKLIESAAFTNSNPHVKDVYVLAKTAPECHVDAFNLKMYIGSNGFSPDIKDGVITRDSYRNGDTWITMLHFPRDCGTPEIQRYWDVTREYSIASNMIDDKGNVIYFPTHTEFGASYTQGTTGYLWNAWDPTRQYGEMSNNYSNSAPWSETVQKNANDYVSGANNKNDLAANPYVSFYDLTNNGNLTHPEGIVYYYNVNWNDAAAKYSTVTPQGNLYPKAVYVSGTGTATTAEPIQLQDAEGYPAYHICDDEGAVIRDYTMEEAKNGAWVRVTVTQAEDGAYVQKYEYVVDQANGNLIKDQQATQNDQGNYVQDYIFEADPEGTYCHPMKAATYENDGRTYYYAKSSGEYIYVPVPEGTPDDPENMWIDEHYAIGESKAEYSWESLATCYNYVQNGWKQLSDYAQCTRYYKVKDISGYEVSDGSQSEVYVIDEDAYVKADGTITADSRRYKKVYVSGYHLAGEGADDQGETRYDVVDNGYKDYVAAEDDGTQTRYTKKYYDNEYRNYDSAKDEGEQRYDIDYNTYRQYTSSDAGKGYTRYDKAYVAHTYRNPNTTGDYGLADAAEDTYCPTMGYVYKDQEVTDSKDYRGWHQFVLGSYATPTDDKIEHHRSYIADNDWWTICLPYDLNYKEMMLFYGDPKTNKVPYLALLTNVVRDLGEQTITLNFSENLMTHKAYRKDGVWHVSDEAPSQDGKAGNGQKVTDEGNDIVLHAGVPYLIRPYRVAGSDGSFNTQFDIYGQTNVNESLSDWRVTATTTDYPLLYDKMHASELLASYEAMALVEKGIYTVPALVKNNDAPADGVEKENVSGTQLPVKINSQKETLPVSSDWDYSFVGNLYYNSFLPQNCYFLGWYNKARFFYADYEMKENGDYSNMNNKNYKFVNVKLWNNNTCIICPNMLTKPNKYHTGVSGADMTSQAIEETQTYLLGKGKHDGLIKPATTNQGPGGAFTPAQWLIGRTLNSQGNGGTALSDDWFKGGSLPQHSASANPVLMEFGVTNMVRPTGIEEVNTNEQKVRVISDDKVYTIGGQYVGTSLQGLQKGIYIMNGKKVVVK